MLKKYKEALITAGIIAVVIALFLSTRSGDTDYRAKYEGAELSAGGEGRQNTYTRYLERYAGVPLGGGGIVVDIFSYTAAEGVSELSNFEGVPRALRMEENSFVEYTVHADRTGMYNMSFEYFPVAGRGIAIERSVLINGETPFLGAEQVTFERVWGDVSSEVRMDNQGNEIRPSQIEKPRWERVSLSDYMGYFTEPYRFYLKAGDNTIRFEGVNEPFVIRAFSLTGVELRRIPCHFQ